MPTLRASLAPRGAASPETMTLGPDELACSVVLREWSTDDVNCVLEAGQDPLIPLITTVPTDGGRDSALAFVERQRDRLTSGEGYSFAIARSDGLGSGEAVGQIGLWLRDLAQGRASVGYWVRPGCRSKGYARTALSALSDWALRHTEVHRLELYVEPWNEPSWRTAASCGYRREGLLRSWQQVGDTRRDMYMYSRLADDNLVEG